MGVKRGQIKIDLGARSYHVFWGEQIWADCVAQLTHLSPEKDVFLLSDTKVAEYYGELWRELLVKHGYTPHFYLINPGEGSKTWREAEKIFTVMCQHNFSRQVPVLALGGGVVGDLAGFVAALYRRGVPFIQIPTTLLAQVDSSIGGKVAVNHPTGKNMLGTFYQPKAVWAELTALQTLSLREWRAGLGEVLKYALLDQEGLFYYLESKAEAILAKELTVLPEMIVRCVQIKAAIVQEDEHDEGKRSILNLGHTFGHALEKATEFQKYLHGEAVAIGLAVALHLALRLGLVCATEVTQVLALMDCWGLPTNFPGALTEKVYSLLSTDKKVARGEIHYVLPVGIGQVTIKKDLPAEIVREALQEASF